MYAFPAKPVRKIAIVAIKIQAFLFRLQK